ncbi:MFS transporter [Kitasatospora sp. NPDC053057]|uniref:MFS transporter n=1 Tax=Kitasatospora sp. NPDC053057 TaxID=3364062 RepID=UPI0037CCBCD1
MTGKAAGGKKWWSFAAERPDFRRLWSAQSISIMGSQVSLIAFPLTALAVLDARASEVGTLNALSRAPFLLFGIFAGVLIDRWRSRRVLIIMDWVRAATLLLIPVLMFSRSLTIEWLFAVAFVVGSCTVFFDIAYQSTLTDVVVAGELLTANRWLETSRSIGNMSGPGFAAVLLKAVSAPIAILVDATSYALSALFVHAIRAPDRRPASRQGSTIWRDFKAGLRFVGESAFLRWNAAIAATWNLLTSALITIFFVHLESELKLSSATVAVVVFVGSVGSFLAVLVVARIIAWRGLGWCIVLSMCVGGLGGLFLAMSSGRSPLAIAALTLGYLLVTAAEPLFNINVISIRQMITPAHLMARTTGAMRFVVWGTLPIGALTAGFLGDAFGGRTTLAVIGVGFLVPAAMTFLSPFPRIRTVSDLDIGDSTQESKEGVSSV